MNLHDYKLIFISVGLIGVLLIATPALSNLIRGPNQEPFSELYILGPEHMASNYPFNIALGQNYSVYVDVGNYLGSSAYYVLYLKLLNQTDTLPNATMGLPSPLPPVCEYRFIVQDNQTHESRLNFSFPEVSINRNQSLINKMIINNEIININKSSILETNKTTYGSLCFCPYQLSVELWIYNSKSNSIEYNNRSVHLLLNITSSLFSS